MTILQRVIEGQLDAYALVFRPDRFKVPTLEVMAGAERILAELGDLDQIQARQRAKGRWGTLVVVPYRHIAERGFTVKDDQKPTLALCVYEYQTLPLEAALAALPDAQVSLRSSAFTPDDAAYADIVERIIRQEIGTGEGSNFVIKRTLTGELDAYDDRVGLTIFRNLLRQERGAHWTFFIRMRGITLVGASPELHIALAANTVAMTPISGTYRFPASGPTQEGLLEFLQNPKEEDELSMVLDEELKMMTDICSSNVRAHGPYLIQMSRLAHAGYRIEGTTELPVSEILKRSMFAPTVVGSPLENATRVIARYETCGRSYYSGFAAIVEDDERGPLLDSAILIRTAEIENDGKLAIGVGATLVRESDPQSETKETAAKAAALQNAMGVNSLSDLMKKDLVAQSLGKWNARMSSFWLGQDVRAHRPRSLYGDAPAIVILDNEDSFTSMIKYQLRELGMTIRVESYATIREVRNSELLIVGPGPGDPSKLTDPRVATSRRMMLAAMEANRPFIAICLGHQILSSLLGLPIQRLPVPNQGLQKQISIFGKLETVGFYNTFVAISEADHLDSPRGTVSVYRDPVSKQVHGLKGPSFCSMQFHPESVLTKDGPRILRDAVFSLRGLAYAG
ncbi:anthranilate synthase family protein [Sorangium sp. So ce118]